MIPTVSNGFLMVSHLSERVEAVFISQLACKGLIIKDAISEINLALTDGNPLPQCLLDLTGIPP